VPSPGWPATRCSRSRSSALPPGWSARGKRREAWRRLRLANRRARLRAADIDQGIRAAVTAVILSAALHALWNFLLRRAGG
jgi:hypothetical protein